MKTQNYTQALNDVLGGYDEPHRADNTDGYTQNQLDSANSDFWVTFNSLSESEQDDFQAVRYIAERSLPA